MTDVACVNCVSRVIYAKGRCRNCYEYRRRTGRDRDEEQAVARARRRFEQQTWERLVRDVMLAAEESA